MQQDEHTSDAMSELEAATDPVTQPQIVFRGKKRKAYRQRLDSSEDASRNIEQQTPTQHIPAPNAPAPIAGQDESAESDDIEQAGLSVAELLRRRNARKSRLGGVTFGGENASRGDATAQEDDLSLMIREEENKMQDAAAATNRRFVQQTGLTREVVDKHMTKFIEAELAKRHSVASPGSPTTSNPSSSNTLETSGVPVPLNGKKQDKHTALQGKLIEIDLGDEVRARNEALTERARRKLQGENVEDEDQMGGRHKKVRLGRDGKPWRPRNRRGSDDIKRDHMVEEILRENRLDVYENPTPQPDGPSAVEDDNEGGAADDRIAEQFRREFMDAMAQRHRQKKKSAASTKPGAKKTEEILKGPKLGGSRNARAAMRDILLQQQQAAKRG